MLSYPWGSRPPHDDFPETSLRKTVEIKKDEGEGCVVSSHVKSFNPVFLPLVWLLNIRGIQGDSSHNNAWREFYKS
jgi:hypothetical protein